MQDKIVWTRQYSGPGRSGICHCGCSWDEHHLGMVAKQAYIDQTGEIYIPQECEAYGFNETGGLKYDDTTDEWVEHCFGYRDSLVQEEHN